MEIRLANDTDLEQLLKYDHSISQEELKSLVSSRRIFIAEEEGRFFGWLRYNLFWDHIPFMNMLYVLEPERGKGYGKALVERWEREMKNAGYSRVMTSTVSQEYAQHFYVKLGYQCIGGFLLPGDPYEIILTKQIETKPSVAYYIREMKPEEYPMLEEFLYQAIFQEKQARPLPRAVVRQPELEVYIKDFGQKDDLCFCAEVGGKIVGAAWARVITGYGSVDAATPELAVSLYPDFRGQGIGTAMMEKILNALEEKGYQKVSLSVQKANRAAAWYQRLGFQQVRQTPEEIIMVYSFQKENVWDEN